MSCSSDYKAGRSVYKLLLDTCEQGLVWVVAVIIRPVDPYISYC